MKPIVSIIIPSFNHAIFLGAAIESALNQSLKEIEIIVVDDASTDNSSQILGSIQDDRLSVHFNEQNLGSSATLNRGISISKAPYIAILNSDDIFDPSRLEDCLKALEGSDATLVGTDLWLIDSNGEEVKDPSFWWCEWFNAVKREFVNTRNLEATLFKGNLFVSTSNFFFRRSLLEQTGAFEDLRYTQDYAFVLKALRSSPGKVLWLEEKRLQYRLHSSNTILEDRIPPVIETLLLLSKELPLITNKADKERSYANYKEHLNRLIRYLEEGSIEKGKKNAEIELLSLQTCIDSQEQHITRIQNIIDNQSKEINSMQGVIDDQSKQINSMQGVIDDQSIQINSMQGVIDDQTVFIELQTIEKLALEKNIQELGWAARVMGFIKNSKR